MWNIFLFFAGNETEILLNLDWIKNDVCAVWKWNLCCTKREVAILRTKKAVARALCGVNLMNWRNVKKIMKSNLVAITVIDSVAKASAWDDMEVCWEKSIFKKQYFSLSFEVDKHGKMGQSNKEYVEDKDAKICLHRRSRYCRWWRKSVHCANY